MAKEEGWWTRDVLSREGEHYLLYRWPKRKGGGRGVLSREGLARGRDGEEARGTSSMASHTAAFRPRAGVEGPSIPYTVIVRMVLGGVLGYKAQRDE